ncbi:hypothetical protein M8J75_002293 [Diaphorina citri]|nr:hypothetical protein M8J75_002293 [Diaphorina citri]
MVLNKSLQMEILRPHLIETKEPGSVFKNNFRVCYYYSKIFGTFPCALKSRHEDTGRLDIGMVTSIIHGAMLLMMIQQNVLNSLNQLALLEKLHLKSPQNDTFNPHNHMRIFLAKFTNKTDYVALIFYMGAFLTSIRMAKQVASLQRYFDQLNEDIEEQKKLLPDVFVTERSDPTFRRSVQLTLSSSIVTTIGLITSRIREPVRAIPLTELYKFGKDFVKISSMSYCLEFLVLCTMLKYHFSYANGVLLRMSSMEKVWQAPWFNGVLEKVGIWHRTLSQTMVQINQIHQLQNLLSVISCTIHILPHLFLMGIRLLGSIEDDNYTIIQFLLSGGRYILAIFLRCHFASIVTHEANKTKMYLCDFLMKHNDPQLTEQIKIILQQMSSGTTSFQLCGLVNLDNSLFLSTMLALVGYFIIILQSYMSEVDSEN